MLPAFVSYLEHTGASTFTVEAALGWATQPPGVQPYRWKQRLSVVRGFARYLHALDPAVPVPPSDLLVYRRRRPTPHLFSDTDITRLLSAAAARPRPLSAATYYALFGLLAATGMRVGEAVGLETGDVDLAAGVIVIRETKFNKSRRIPLRSSTVAVLRDYLQLRQRLCPAPKALCFFVSSRAGRITTRRAQAMFARLVKVAGLEPGPGPIRGCTISGIVSRSRPCSIGIATAPTSTHGCLCCRPTLVTSARYRPTGICRPPRSCWPWPPDGSSSTTVCGHDRAGTHGRDVLHPTVGHRA